MKTEPNSINASGFQRRIKLLGVELMPSEIILSLGLGRAFEKLGNFLGQQEQRLPMSWRKYVWLLLAVVYCLLLTMDLFIEKREEHLLNQVQIPKVIPPDPVLEIMKTPLTDICNSQPLHKFNHSL